MRKRVLVGKVLDTRGRFVNGWYDFHEIVVRGGG